MCLLGSGVYCGGAGAKEHALTTHLQCHLSVASGVICLCDWSG